MAKDVRNCFCTTGKKDLINLVRSECALYSVLLLLLLLFKWHCVGFFFTNVDIV